MAEGKVLVVDDEPNVREYLAQILLDAGHRLRVYVPYGPDWYPYSIRRLRENPEVAGHVARAFLGMAPATRKNWCSCSSEIPRLLATRSRPGTAMDMIEW